MQDMLKSCISWHVWCPESEKRGYSYLQVIWVWTKISSKSPNNSPNYFQKFIKKYSFLVIKYESKQGRDHSVYYAKFGQRTWMRKNVTLASLAQVVLYMCKYFQAISKYDLCEVQTWQIMYTMIQAKTVKYLITNFHPYFIKLFVPKQDP